MNTIKVKIYSNDVFGFRIFHKKFPIPHKFSPYLWASVSVSEKECHVCWMMFRNFFVGKIRKCSAN